MSQAKISMPSSNHIGHQQDPVQQGPSCSPHLFLPTIPFKLSVTLNVLHLFPGRWEIDSGKLFQGFREPCLQHCRPYRRSATCGRCNQAFGSVPFDHASQQHCSEKSCGSLYSDHLRHSICHCLCNSKSVTNATDQPGQGRQDPLHQPEGSQSRVWREESSDGVSDWRVEREKQWQWCRPCVGTNPENWELE